MKFIINLIKKAIGFVKKLFNGKNPIEVVNNITKDVAAVATAGIGIVATVNLIRVRLMKSKKSSNEEYEAPADYYRKKYRGDAKEQLAKMRKIDLRKEREAIEKEDLEALEILSKSRNIHFQSLTPKLQLELLEMEDFDFEAYKKKLKAEKSRPLFRWGNKLKQFGKVSPDLDKPFRDKVDYGVLNFILRPLDRFVHWYKCDPVPERVPQIQLVAHEDIPSIMCDSREEMIDTLRELDLSRIRVNHKESKVIGRAAIERQYILAQEVGKTKNYDKFQRKVRRRIMSAKYATPTGLELLDDFEPDKKKKKKKKSFADDEYYGPTKKDKKKKKKDKSGKSFDGEKLDPKSVKKAREAFEYFVGKAQKGENDYDGFWE